MPLNLNNPKPACDAHSRYSLSAGRILLILAGFIALICFAIIVCDRPIAYASHHFLAPYKFFFKCLTYSVALFQVGAAIGALWVLIQYFFRHRLSVLEVSITRICCALYVSMGVKDQLKYTFGRTWPETWVCDNPSLIRDGVFGFFPFHAGEGWASFPSGHETVTCAIVVCASLLWPGSGKFLWIFIPLVAIGLLGADHHFFSDILVGGSLGALIGYIAARIGATPPPYDGSQPILEDSQHRLHEKHRV